MQCIAGCPIRKILSFSYPYSYFTNRFVCSMLQISWRQVILVEEVSIMSIHKLLEPGSIGTMQLKNRIIYSSMDLRSTDGKGHMSPEAVESVVYHAEHGPGLVHFPGVFAWSIPDVPFGLTLSLGDDSFIPPLKEAVRRVHAAGAKAVQQLYARGTRTSNGAETIGPSAMRFGFDSNATRELSLEEIQQYVEWFGDAALRVKKADFDAVEIHACTGKLIHMFLSPYSNHRTDAYGGSTEKRARFLIEVLQNVRKKVGADFPVIVRLGVDDMFAQGLHITESLEIVRFIEPYLDALQVSGGSQEHIWNISCSYFYEHGYLLPFVKAVRKVTKKPLIAMGKLGEPALAEQVIADGIADFVNLGRPLLVDPFWIEKAQRGEEAAIKRCIGCLNCFTFNSRTEIVPPHSCCTVNPGVLRERAYEKPVPTEKPQKILVAGGGLAGMEAAAILAQRGHCVTICEKSAHLGGQWRVAAHSSHKGDYRTLIPAMQQDLKAAGVQIRLQTEVDQRLLLEQQPDLVVLATGAVPRTLPHQCSVHGPNVVQGNDVIMDQAEVGDRVVIIGGRYIGAEVAVKLSAQGKKVALVDQTEIGKGTNPRIIGIYRNQMVEQGVYLYPNCPVLSIHDGGVNISHLGSLLTLSADTVVLAVGTVPAQDLVVTLDALGISYHSIGDCKRIGDALYAIRDGAELGHKL